ncbi:MAG: carbohydrate kinase [Eubacterium sp.]|nr:carbohydrate kinase [Candidatus Colimonas fimequi]
MRKDIDIVALGELLIDFAESGTSENGNSLLEVCPGGAPCNMLAMAKKLGKEVAFIGKVGRDNFGNLLRSVLQDVGINDEGLAVDEEIPTTLAFVHTLEDGDREFSFYRNPGADMMLRPEDIKTDLIERAKVFHFGTLSMTDENVKAATVKALETAKNAGCIISFDPNLRPPLWDDLEKAKEAMRLGFEYCDVLKIADNEIQFISGVSDYDEGIQMLIEEYDIPLILLTLGKEGSTAYYKGMRVNVPGYKVNTIETTGAGDSFCGSTVSQVIDRGLDNLTQNDLREMLTLSNGAAAIVTTRKGAIRSMPELEEIKELQLASK